MKLSEIIRDHLITSVIEGTYVVVWGEVFSTRGTFLQASYGDELEYEAIFEDQDVTLTDGNRFVVSCDGEPWEFAAWSPAWGT